MHRNSSSPTEPVAIIGVACRFPQAADVAAFWTMLCQKQDAIGDVPADRWNAADFHRTGTNRGGFLAQIDQFDPQFFRISPREAMQMDPRQRLLLELTWEALEDAGVPADTLRNSLTGVFCATMWQDYATLLKGGPAHITLHTATGQDASIIANRISYTFGLRGPSLTINTSCSSSLVAIHLACQSLQTGDCDLALVGGVNLLVSPETSVAMTKFGALSPNHVCRTFDAQADGYVRSEGGGMVVLKPLSLALAAGDPIYCLVRGSAVNNNGAGNGLTAPDFEAQAALLQQAYRRAHLPAQRVHYVETHGTGTKLGDPVETKALGAVLGAQRSAQPLRIGSVKTNIGHLEAASGMAGLIKTVLAIKHRLIPPSLHFAAPNPLIDFAAWGLTVQTELTEWPEPEQPAVAGVNSFGFGGTNAHVVLEAPYGAPAYPVFLSGVSKTSLQAAAQTLADIIAHAPPSLPLADLCYTGAQSTEPGLPHRLGFTARSRAELYDRLTGFAQGETRSELAYGAITEPQASGPVFVFSGMGTAWPGVGQQLLMQEPVFWSTVRQCDQIFQAQAGWSLLATFGTTAPSFQALPIEVTWPLHFAVQVALARLWQAWGVTPAAVIGASIGEVAAAHIAGALTLTEALQVIYHQSRLVQAMNGAALHTPLLKSIEPELSQALRQLCPRPTTIPFFSGRYATGIQGEQLDATYWSQNLSAPVRFVETVSAVAQTQPCAFVEISPQPIAQAAIVQCLQQQRYASVCLPSLQSGADERLTMLNSLMRLYTLGQTVNRQALYPTTVRPLPAQSSFAEASPNEPTAFKLLPLSAHQPAALDALVKALATQLEQQPNGSLLDLCYTASLHRAHLDYRLALVADSLPALQQTLAEFVAGKRPPTQWRGPAQVDPAPKVVFVFPGQGAQWFGMGRQLFAREPVFRHTLIACAEAMAQFDLDWSLLAEFLAVQENASFARIDVIQPLLFALQVSLAALWRAWGITPAAVVGHSMGEVAAAYVAGALSLHDAAHIICQRSKLMRRLSGQGAMLLVELSLAEAAERVQGLERQVSLAVSNSPRTTVLSGDTTVLQDLMARLTQQGIFCRMVQVDVASHSPQVEPLADDLRALLAALQPQPTVLPLYSTVTGAIREGVQLDADYWVQNLRQPVLFSAVRKKLVDDGYTIFLEISPHPILLPAIEQGLQADHQSALTLASLRRQQDEQQCLLEALGQLYLAGHAIQWASLYPQAGRRVAFPIYPWQRARFWLDEAALTPSHEPLAVNRWLYQLAWQAKPGPTPTPADEPAGPWLVLTDQQGVGDALVATLEGQGQRCTVLPFGGDLKGALAGAEPYRGIIHLWSLDSAGPLLEAGDRHQESGAIPLRSLDGAMPARREGINWAHAQQVGCGSLLTVIQALTQIEKSADTPRLWVVTRGAQAVTAAEAVPGLAQAPLWGMGRTLAAEQPAFWGGLLDVDPNAAPRDIAAFLAAEIRQTDGEDLVAQRQGQRYVARLGRWQAPLPPQPRPIAADASYLITGGLGDLGLALAQWFVAQGARYLTLVSRTPLPPRATWPALDPNSRPGQQTRAIQALERSGVTLSLHAADVADPAQLAAILQAAPRPMRGVIHAAGVLHYQALHETDEVALQTVLAAKVLGSWNLHQLLKEQPLDFFVLFSSGAALLNSPLLGSYAAANAFLDSLAHYRCAQGLPALSLNWGFWADIGMAARHEAIVCPAGMQEIPVQQGLQLLGRLLSLPDPQIAILPIDWDAWQQAYPQAATSALVRHLVQRTGRPPETGAPLKAPGQPSLRETLNAAEVGKARRLHLENYLREQLAAILRTQAHLIDPQTPFRHVGLDSLMAVEFRNRIEGDTGLTLSATLSWNYPTIAELASYIADRMQIPLEAAVAAPAESGDNGGASSEAADQDLLKLLLEVETLSDEEVQALLTK